MGQSKPAGKQLKSLYTAFGQHTLRKQTTRNGSGHRNMHRITFEKLPIFLLLHINIKAIVPIHLNNESKF